MSLSLVFYMGHESIRDSPKHPVDAYAGLPYSSTPKHLKKNAIAGLTGQSKSHTRSPLTSSQSTTGTITLSLPPVKTASVRLAPQADISPF